MDKAGISLLTVCGLEELDGHGGSGVTHVLSILDPGWPDPESFSAYDRRHQRTVLRFHDIVEDLPDMEAPRRDHVERILAFGLALDDREGDGTGQEGHLLIHCHMGISRSTAAMAMLMAQAHPDESGDAIMARLVAIRPQAWPNGRMMGFADELLSRGGDLSGAASRLHARQMAEKPHLVDIFRGLGRAREVDAAMAAASPAAAAATTAPAA